MDIKQMKELAALIDYRRKSLVHSFNISVGNTPLIDDNTNNLIDALIELHDTTDKVQQASSMAQLPNFPIILRHNREAINSAMLVKVCNNLQE